MESKVLPGGSAYPPRWAEESARAGS